MVFLFCLFFPIDMVGVSTVIMGKLFVVCSEDWITTVEFLDLELLVKGLPFKTSMKQ